MNEFEYIYMKKRKEFGRFCNFDDVDAKILGQVDPKPESGDMYLEQTILNLVLDNIPQFSEHAVNTARVKTASRTMIHTEGGWPKEIDAAEAQDTLKWRKRLDKDPAFTTAVEAAYKTNSCLPRAEQQH